MAVANAFTFGSPLVGKFAIDTAHRCALDLGIAALAEVSRRIGAIESLLAYLAFSALASVLLAVGGGVFLHLRGQLVAVASEAICRRSRGTPFVRPHHVPVAFLDNVDTGELVQRCGSDMETGRVFLSVDISASPKRSEHSGAITGNRAD